MELLIVVSIALIVMALATPLIVNALKNYRLRQAGVNYANMLQMARMRAVQDDTYYPVITSTSGSNACVDLNQSGSCTSSTSTYGAEPQVFFHSTIQFQSPASAPGNTNLRSQYLPSTCGTTCVSVNPNTLPIGPAFGSRGLPCNISGTVCNYTSGSVPVAFETYLQNTQTSAWEAVTVSPAGRIREWYYDTNSSTWNPLN